MIGIDELEEVEEYISALEEELLSERERIRRQKQLIFDLRIELKSEIEYSRELDGIMRNEIGGSA